MQDDDDRMDEMVRAASAFPVDTGRMTQTVLTRIRDDDGGVFGVFGSHLRGVAVAFGVVLAAVPMIVLQLPATGLLASDDAAVAALVMGDGLLGAGALDAMLAGEVVE